MNKSVKYRLAAIDLDGTLLHSGTHKVSPGNAAAVERALAQGATIILASGRQHETTAAFAAELRIPPETPIISYNGALVRRLSGETLSHHPLPPDVAEYIVRVSAERGYHLNYYLDDLLYVRDETQWSRLYQQRTGSMARVVGDLACFDGRRPTKILLIDTKEVTDRLLRDFQAHYGDSLYITKTEDEYLEFMDKGVSKGAALAEAAALLGVPQAQCVALGDSYNDVPMLRWASLGVAMTSGKEVAKQAAALLAPPADDDGVGAVLDQIFAPAEPIR